MIPGNRNLCHPPVYYVPELFLTLLEEKNSVIWFLNLFINAALIHLACLASFGFAVELSVPFFASPSYRFDFCEFVTISRCVRQCKSIFPVKWVGNSENFEEGLTCGKEEVMKKCRSGTWSNMLTGEWEHCERIMLLFGPYLDCISLSALCGLFCQLNKKRNGLSGFTIALPFPFVRACVEFIIMDIFSWFCLSFLAFRIWIHDFVAWDWTSFPVSFQVGLSSFSPCPLDVLYPRARAWRKRNPSTCRSWAKGATFILISREPRRCTSRRRCWRQSQSQKRSWYIQPQDNKGRVFLASCFHHHE